MTVIYRRLSLAGSSVPPVESLAFYENAVQIIVVCLLAETVRVALMRKTIEDADEVHSTFERNVAELREELRRLTVRVETTDDDPDTLGRLDELQRQLDQANTIGQQSISRSTTVTRSSERLFFYYMAFVVLLQISALFLALAVLLEPSRAGDAAASWIMVGVATGLSGVAFSIFGSLGLTGDSRLRSITTLLVMTAPALLLFIFYPSYN